MTRFALAAAPASGLARIPHLDAFLPEVERIDFSRRPAANSDAVLGWGARPSANWARRTAERRGIPLLTLEDGFLRSVSLGQAGAPPMSLVLDRSGIYFDARRPSDLETMLETSGVFDGALLAEAREAIALKNRLRLSKYNRAPALSLGAKTRRRVLVLDQTAGDASIAGALATRDTFDAMLAAALAENPSAEIIVKLHPATTEGFRGGCIDTAKAGRARLLAEACDPIALLEQVDAVYTVSSLTGFEAMVLGIPVRCFGVPFYAGWGATADELPCPRRSARRSVEEIFAAAYLRYARYVDPLTGKTCSIFAAMERLALFKARAASLHGPFACNGFAPWKHAPVRDVLGAAGDAVDFRASARAANHKAKATGGKAVLWAARETPKLRAALEQDDVPILRMEDGFLRSVGLGSDFHRASSYVLDDVGIYYDAERPSRLEILLQNETFDAAMRARAAALREKIVAAGLSKYNVGEASHDGFAGAGARLRVLVVGQVEDDASIRKGCADIASNAALLAAVRAARPEAFVLYKAHPDVVAGNRRGRLSPEEAARADRCIEGGDIAVCIADADELHTMTSLAGFEALLRGKTVFTYGRPFYAGWGLSHDRLACERRTRRLTLDELVAGALIAYPLYVDPRTRLPCTPEFLLERLAEEKARGGTHRASRGLAASASRYLRAFRESAFAQPRARI